MAGKLRTLWQARGGEIAQLNIPAVFFHPPLDGRDFLYRPAAGMWLKRAYSFFRFLFSFLRLFLLSLLFSSFPLSSSFFRSSFFRSFHLSSFALSPFFLFFVSFPVLPFSLFSAFLFLLSVLFFPPFPPFPLCSLRI